MKKETTPKPVSDANTNVQTGDAVTLHYKGTLGDGQTFDSSEGRTPLTFTAGENQVIPGFDTAVMGMKIGDKKVFTILTEEAYGPIRAELMKEFPRANLPEGMEPKVGMPLAMQGPQGQSIPVTIVKVTPENVTIDLNHPLAGKDLTFDIEIVAINDPQYTSSMDEEEEGGCCGSGSCGESSEGSEGGCGSGACCDEESPKEGASCSTEKPKKKGGCGSGACGSQSHE